MSHRPDRARSDAAPAALAPKRLLRFITCGSVDDGKRTVIGRLLYESQGLFDYQLAAVVADSQRSGITIDVAYRYFSTARRKFIVADTPGHEQYTRNMVTGASSAEAAVILVDVRKGGCWCRRAGPPIWRH